MTFLEFKPPSFQKVSLNLTMKLIFQMILSQSIIFVCIWNCDECNSILKKASFSWIFRGRKMSTEFCGMSAPTYVLVLQNLMLFKYWRRYLLVTLCRSPVYMNKDLKWLQPEISLISLTNAWGLLNTNKKDVDIATLCPEKHHDCKFYPLHIHIYFTNLGSIWINTCSLLHK